MSYQLLLIDQFILKKMVKMHELLYCTRTR